MIPHSGYAMLNKKEIAARQTYQIICLCGGQAAVTAVITAVVTAVINRGRKAKQKQEQNTIEFTAIKLGLQAVLRNILYQMYSKCNTVKEVTLDEKDDFNNIWKQYHNLGANGVMDDIKKNSMIYL